MEDFNQPSAERVDLLKCLQEKIGSITPHLCAACQICDLSALERFLRDRVLVFRVSIWQPAKRSAIVSQIALL